MSRRSYLTLFFLILTVHSFPAAAPAQTSLTLQQIVARQEENYRRIRTADGEVVWKEEFFTTRPASNAPLTRMIFFALEGQLSVNLILPWNESQPMPRRDEGLDWKRVMAASFVEGEIVHTITLPARANAPVVQDVPFNPAVHDRNPLVAFHPRLLGDERVTLGDLATLVPKMATRPRIGQFTRGGKRLLRIDFYNTAAQGDLLYYVLNPEKGFLAEEIGRLVAGRFAFQVRIIIGQTRDGTYIPARRERDEYDSAGRITKRESWFYNALGVNETLARRQLSLGFFHLPAGTKLPPSISTNEPARGQTPRSR